MARNEIHNQEQYEAYINQDVEARQKNGTFLKNCDCYSCEEETRVLAGDFLRNEMGMSNEKINETLKNYNVKVTNKEIFID